MAAWRGSVKMPGADLLLGVDGGGQATQAVIATADGGVLGRGLGPPSNYHRVGVDSARRAVKTAIERAFLQPRDEGSGLGPSATTAWPLDGGIRAAFFGLSGVDGPEDEAAFLPWLRGLGCKFKVAIGNNSELILGGGTPSGWGVALISSTGSVCFGRTPTGEAVRVGGWGHVLGDEGSGYQIATEALKLATQAADDRGGSPALLQAALKNWGLREPKDLIGFICRPETTAEDVSSFAIRVLELAARDEPKSREIVDRAACALALQVDSVVRQLRLEAPPLAVGGSMMRPTLQEALLERLQTAIGPVASVPDPVRGAIVNAQRLL
jgi:N-acetylglucosamine kinase-like BadF-type ATPase